MTAQTTSAPLDVNECDFVESPNFSKICKSGRPCQIGIDEAGRGPVLGPMVYGVGVMPLDSDEKLREHGVGDSKQLTEEKRDEMFALFNESDCELVAWAVRVISPAHLSRVMQQRVKYSLNDESHDSCMSLIQHCIDAGANINGVFVDTVGPPETYQAKLERRFPALTITVSKKADSIYTVVGAASIAAKDGSSWPVVYGVAATTGLDDFEIFPARFPDKGPDLGLRSARHFGGKSTLLDIYDPVTHQLRIPPFHYNSIVDAHRLANQSDQWIRQHMSTSPEVEPDDFADSVRRCLTFVSEHPDSQVVFNDLPRVYVMDEGSGSWLPDVPE